MFFHIFFLLVGRSQMEFSHEFFIPKRIISMGIFLPLPEYKYLYRYIWDVPTSPSFPSSAVPLFSPPPQLLFYNPFTQSTAPTRYPSPPRGPAHSRTPSKYRRTHE